MLGLEALYKLLFVFAFLLSTNNAIADAGDTRIVSLAPSITEIVFALGSGEQLVGVTTFCDYPEAAKQIKKVGGFSDLNIETLLSLEPTIVFGMIEHSSLTSPLRSFGIKSQLFEQGTFEEISASIKSIGQSLGKPSLADQLIQEMKKEIASVTEKTKKLSLRPKVLVTVGGHIKPDSVEATYGAGKSTLYNELIELAGGENILSTEIDYVKLSAESLLSLNPDIVIDLIPATVGNSKSEQAQTQANALAAWNSLKNITAVKNKNVHILSQEFITNPGPRTSKTLKLFSEIIIAGSR